MKDRELRRWLASKYPSYYFTDAPSDGGIADKNTVFHLMNRVAALEKAYNQVVGYLATDLGYVLTTDGIGHSTIAMDQCQPKPVRVPKASAK